MSIPADAEAVLSFWFIETEARQRFRKDPEFDELINRRFQSIHRSASLGHLANWRDHADSALAEIIVLDQFSRNLYRDQPAAFAQDVLALVLAQEAIRRGQDLQLEAERRAFLYMPFMHSESALIHESALTLFGQPGLEKNLDFELRHKAIIDRFGRYPHRNEILGRTSSAEELAFLQQPGSGF